MKTIDLHGPDGNAYCLLGLAKIWSRQLELDGEAIRDEMRSGNYSHLVETFEKHFGMVCQLINKPGEEEE